MDIILVIAGIVSVFIGGVIGRVIGRILTPKHSRIWGLGGAVTVVLLIAIIIGFDIVDLCNLLELC